eukprot:2487056-Pleurochrysis_carterae.AAC.1
MISPYAHQFSRPLRIRASAREGARVTRHLSPHRAHDGVASASAAALTPTHHPRGASRRGYGSESWRLR